MIDRSFRLQNKQLVPLITAVAPLQNFSQAIEVHLYVHPELGSLHHNASLDPSNLTLLHFVLPPMG
jgi:hypothetical protein